MPFGVPDVVYHGPTTFIPLTYDPYTAPKRMGIFRQINDHPFQHVNAGEIVDRILRSREAYEERQRAKLQKAIIEEQVKSEEKSLAGELGA
jgi:ethanolamine-phosphate cytidylyltransferase